jgi:hypothetical protein
MSIFNRIKVFFKDNRKEIVRRFLSEELDYKNGEILRQTKILKSLEKDRERLELMVFGN